MKERLTGFLIVAMIITMGLAGWSYAQSQSASIKLQSQVKIVCVEHRLLADIAKEQLATQIQNSKIVIPKIRFPGLSSMQVQELEQQKLDQEEKNLGKLETVAKATC